MGRSSHSRSTTAHDEPRSNLAFPEIVNGAWRDLAFEHFRDGIKVHWLRRGSDVEPSVAVLNYQPGASVPRHRHAGLETIVVLEGKPFSWKWKSAVPPVIAPFASRVTLNVTWTAP